MRSSNAGSGNARRFAVLAGLVDGQLNRVGRLLRPRFTVLNECIIRSGERGDAVYFIAHCRP